MKPQQRELDFSIPLIAIVILIAVLASSCAANGYGCHGRSKIMTRVR
jgi:hypothetical protein